MLEDSLFLIVCPPPTHSLLKWQRWSVLVFPWLPPKVTQCSQNVAVSLCTLTLFQAKAVKWRILHSVLSVPGIWSFHPSFWVYLHTDIVFINLKVLSQIQYYESRYECFLISVKRDIHCFLFSLLFSIGLQRRGQKWHFSLRSRSCGYKQILWHHRSLSLTAKNRLESWNMEIFLLFFFPLIKSAHPSS